LLTERRLPESGAIDAMSTAQILRLINTQDVEVPIIVRNAIPAISSLVDAVVEAMAKGGRLIYAGAGTSGRLGVLDATECPPTFFCESNEVIGIIAGGDAALRTSSESREDDPAGPVEEFAELSINEHDVVVGIAAGGTTPWVWGALRLANTAKAQTGFICCVHKQTLLQPNKAKVVPANVNIELPPRPQLPAEVNHFIELPVGPEVVTGSTRMKAGTATKLALNMITTSVMIKRGKVWGNLMVDVRATNAKLRDRAARILIEQCGIERDEAIELLDQADGRVKTAIVMYHEQLGRMEAEQLLNEHSGRLRPILGSPK